MGNRMRGFTLIELLIVIVVGGLLVQLAIKGVGEASSRMSARESRNVVQGMMARTRAQAIESGVTTTLLIDAAGDSVMVLANGEVGETVNFREVFEVDIQAKVAMTWICMTPRGFANPDCNSFDKPVQIAFVRGAQSDTLEILPMGQLRW